MINHYEIEPEELFKILKNKNQQNNIAIIDVREDDERTECGMIENSIIMPFASLNNNTIKEFVINNNKHYRHIYIYCKAGVRSAITIQMFIKHLKENNTNNTDTQFIFYNLKGGMNNWLDKGYSFIK